MGDARSRRNLWIKWCLRVRLDRDEKARWSFMPTERKLTGGTRPTSGRQIKSDLLQVINPSDAHGRLSVRISLYPIAAG